MHPPLGARHQYEYNCPSLKPNENFNFWKDIQTNVNTRANWDNAAVTSRNVVENYLSGGMLANFHQNEEERPYPARGCKSANKSRERANVHRKP